MSPGKLSVLTLLCGSYVSENHESTESTEPYFPTASAVPGATCSAHGLGKYGEKGSL